MKKGLVLAFVLAALPAFAQTAQTPAPPAPGGSQPPQSASQAPADPLSTYLRNQSNAIKTNIVKSAEKLTEADYGFRPSGVAPEVRTFGQLLGHLANANFMLCSRAKGEPSPGKQDFEKTTAKADLVKALNDAFAYCDEIYGSLTDAKAMELMTVQGPNNTTRQVLRAAPLMSNISHNNEHYGNLVTYLRAKGIVPPSSERTSQD